MEDYFQSRNNTSFISQEEKPIKQVCVNINKFMPANSILEGRYEPDQPVRIALKKSQHNIQSRKQISERVCPMKEEICSLFDEEDTLGYEYQHFFRDNKLVYSRFFLDKRWIEMTRFQQKQKEVSLRYLGGLFFPNTAFTPAKGQINQIYNGFYPLQQIQEEINYKPYTIKFNANYPSSNLLMAFQKNTNEYDLILHNDTNCKGSTQWFNFSVTFPRFTGEHVPSNFTYKFNIVNLTKANSLFTKGMKPLFISNIDSKWGRVKSGVEYSRTDVLIEGSERSYSRLSFCYACQTEYDYPEKVIFSYGYPYAVEEHEEFWGNYLIKNSLTQRFKSASRMQVDKKIIGKTITNLPIQAYQVRDEVFFRNLKKNNPSRLSHDENSSLRSLVFLARQHPGETQGSFIMEGIMEWLTLNPAMAQHKRRFVYYFIPMVNVQGIILGNYRTNIMGYDLNRGWRHCKKQAQPEVIAIKKYLARVNEQNPIALIIDLHGHSKALNSFFYGTGKSKNRESPKLFAYFCSKRIKPISFAQSKFTVSKNKRNTARVVLSQMFPQALVYTLQNSFYGYLHPFNLEKIIEFTPDTLKKLGKDLLSAYLQYVNLGSNRNSGEKKKLQAEVETFEIDQKLKEEKIQIYSDSDSEADQYLMDREEVFLNLPSDHSFGNQNQSYTQKKITSRKMVRLKTPIQTTQRKCLSKSGKYLKTIQLIDNARDQLEEGYVHQLQSDEAHVLKNQVDGNSMTKKQDRAPLMAVRQLHPKVNEFINNRIISANKLLNKSKPNQFLNFINEKELAYQQIRLRRLKGEARGENMLSEDLLKTSSLKVGEMQKFSQPKRSIINKSKSKAQKIL